LLAVLLGVQGAPEWWEYDVIAANLASGEGHVFDRDGLVYLAYAPPLWSYVLAVLQITLGSSRTWIQILQSLLCFGSALVYGRLAERMTGRAGVGLLTSLLVAWQPSLLYYSVVKSDPLPCNVLLVGLILLSAADRGAPPSPSRAATFGSLVALGVLSRGTPVVALPLVLAALSYRWRGASLKPALSALFSFALVLAPWLARNWVILGAPLITSTAGENFWNGNHEAAYSRVSERDGRPATLVAPENTRLPESVRLVLAERSEAALNDAFMAEAWRFIGAHPEQAFDLFVGKMRTFWWRIESDPRDYPPAASLAYEWIYRIELGLALLGAAVVLLKQRGPSPAPDRVAAALALGLMVSISVLQSAFYVQGRHRFMIEPLLLIFTATGLFALHHGFRKNPQVSREGGTSPSAGVGF